MLGHQDLHRIVKELVKFDATLKDTSLEFSTRLSQIMSKNLDECLKTRACWIFVSFLETENTKSLVMKDLVKNKKSIEALFKQSEKGGKGNKGLEMILSKLKK